MTDEKKPKPVFSLIIDLEGDTLHARVQTGSQDLEQVEQCLYMAMQALGDTAGQVNKAVGERKREVAAREADMDRYLVQVIEQTVQKMADPEHPQHEHADELRDFAASLRKQAEIGHD